MRRVGFEGLGDGVAVSFSGSATGDGINDGFGMTGFQLALDFTNYQRLNCTASRWHTGETALLLAEALGTTPQLWMHIQMNHDLWAAARQLAERRARSV